MACALFEANFSCQTGRLAPSAIVLMERANVHAGSTEMARSANEIRKLLVDADLRPTRQRVLLATLLFGRGDRHITAELLHSEVLATGTRVSLAPVEGDALVTLEGVAYPLGRGELPADACLGLGNAVAGRARITVHEGAVAVFVHDGEETFGRRSRSAP